MDIKFLGANPIFPVKDVKETASFYEEKLDFKTTILWEDPAYGVVRRGNAVIEFGDRRKEYAGSGVCIIFVDNADVIYEEWKNREIEFVGDLANRNYGSRDFRIRDNNGNMLIIAQDMEIKDELLQKGNVA